MKKRKVLAVCALCLASMAVGAASAGLIEEVTSEIRRDFTIVIDGVEKSFKNADGDNVYPMLYEGTTYLPIRAIGEMMGKTVYWYEDEKKIEFKDNSSTVTDADVIVTGDDKNNSSQTEKPVRPENNRPPHGAKPDRRPIEPREGELTPDEAKKIAFEKAGVEESEDIPVRIKLDTDDGVRVYDIDFLVDRTEYSAEIKAADGTILDWDIDVNDDDDWNRRRPAGGGGGSGSKPVAIPTT